MKKNRRPKYDSVDSVPALLARMDEIREAQAVFATFTQEATDKIFTAAASAASKARIPLAKMAVLETGMGVMEDKVIKNLFASEEIYSAYKDMPTCGIIEKDEAAGIIKVAEPVGVVTAVIPTTNPTSTAIFKTLLALKTRNGMIISSHPRAKGCTIAAAKIVLEAAVAAGAPKGIIGWIDEPSLELTNTAMKEANLILATGGPGMVSAAYSSGKPAVGVGAGNTPAVIDDTADVLLAVNSIIHSKTFDNGMICASEQSVIVLDGVYDAVKEEFTRRGCYFLNKEELDKVRRTIIINGSLNGRIVGQSAHRIGELSGIETPEDVKILIGEVEDTELTEEFAYEKLSPVLAMYNAKSFDEAVAKAERLIEIGGMGHTSSLYVDVTQYEKLNVFYAKMKTCRVLVNTPASHGAIGGLYNTRLTPSLTLGCGSWGGNSVSENVGAKHLLNIKTVAMRRENMLWFQTPEKIYIKRGCLSAALEELKETKKRIFVVTDKFLNNNGFISAITGRLGKLGITHTVFYDVDPDPTIASARSGAEAMRAFAPDCVIAFGGGSAIDAAKIMWLLYEHPDADFADMSMRFSDIKKRIYRFPKLGEKAYFVAIPTTAGTGSEVTPFAVITDGEKGIKYPIADYELLPDMAVVDCDLMMSQPKSLTAASGIDAAVHALEAYLSMLATDYTNAMAIRALKVIFEYLPKAYEDGTDVTAREKMADAATIAGIAFANAFLGVCHSMAHKLGAFYHLPHGVANALLITEVIRFNSTDKPIKMGTFPQYGYPQGLRRYAEIAESLGLGGEGDSEKCENLIQAIEELKASIGIKAAIKDYGIDEKEFIDRLDEMAEQAFDDQCTGANPRYPLISEMRQMYLNAYYGS